MNNAEPSRETLLIKAFVEVADTLVADYDIIALLDRLASHCVELLAADAAGIVLADPSGKLRVVASTNEQTAWMELLQLQADDGPCVECFRTATAISVVDLVEAGHRWPRFATAITADFPDREPYRSVHALPLRLRGEPIGALNLFHHQPGPLPPADLALGQALADVATIGILSERAINRGEVLNEQLQVALNSRVVIEQAKGVLAERGNIDMNVAFDRIRRYSRDHNLKLGDVARQIIESSLATVVLAPHPARKARP